MPSPFLKAKAPKISRIFEKDMVKAQKSDGKDVKAKAKAKDNLSINKKPKPIVKPKPTAKDDFEIQERKKLLAWAENNEPDEGWITNDKITEIRLRKRYFDKNIDKNWLDYLSSKEKKGVIEIVKKPEIKQSTDWPKLSVPTEHKKIGQNMDMFSIEKKLKVLNIDELNDESINECIQELQIFFEISKLKLEKKDQISNLILLLTNALNSKNFDEVTKITKKISNTIKRDRTRK